jgi:hypothetical protein
MESKLVEFRAFRLCDIQKSKDKRHICPDKRRTLSPIQKLARENMIVAPSGLCIRDAVTLERHRLNGESLLLYQAKTGTPVYVPLPPHVVGAL